MKCCDVKGGGKSYNVIMTFFHKDFGQAPWYINTNEKIVKRNTPAPLKPTKQSQFTYMQLCAYMYFTIYPPVRVSNIYVEVHVSLPHYCGLPVIKYKARTSLALVM